ncbi:hypothetical protein LTR05_008701 [Lithohypha guttulata]|uniref:Amino acid permease/ SLC12A domain-containing protein n=1 Tax=Lithohypha guttulata TaxID=1690604 RepID=A0AAN7PJH1_9EURO|nr:hypothetical protein LTR05_008701 [Lithohypha guttulata]
MLLAISGIIDVTVFSTFETVLHTASTAGALIALGVVGGITIYVMSSLGEMVILWPVPNALVAYVEYFIGPNLAIVVGVTYWYAIFINHVVELTSLDWRYTWSSVFTGLLISAFDTLCLFVNDPLIRVGIMIAIGLTLVGINGLGIRLSIVCIESSHAVSDEA